MLVSIVAPVRKKPTSNVERILAAEGLRPPSGLSAYMEGEESVKKVSKEGSERKGGSGESGGWGSWKPRECRVLSGTLVAVRSVWKRITHVLGFSSAEVIDAFSEHL